MEGPSTNGGGNALFCRKCGGRLPPDAQFCVRCGERVKVAGQPEQAAQPAFPMQFERPPAQPAPPAQAPTPNAAPAQAAQLWQPGRGMPAQAAAPLPSMLAEAKREKPRPAPRKPMKPWLVVLLSAVGSFAVFGTAVLVIFISLTN